MPTSAGELVDHLDRLATISAGSRQSGTGASDAARALGHLGRAVGELRRVGIDPRVGAEREKLASELADACSEIARRAPLHESTLCRTAAVTADAVALAGLQTTMAGRWALTTELLDVVTVLSDVVAAAPVGPEIDQRLDVVRECTVRLLRDAAQHPPEPRDFTALDRPIPHPGHSAGADLPAVVREATARLINSSEQRDARLTVAQVLARATAAEALARAAEAVGDSGGARPGHAGAGDSWHAVRTALRPFDDGSRRPHRRVDAGTAAALGLHAVLGHAGDPAAWNKPLADAVAASVQLLPVHARQLERTVNRWVADGSVVAHACDLPYRDGRSAAYLAGYSPAGLIRVLDPVDLKPVTGALQRASLLTVATADAATQQRASQEDFPRHLAAAHHATLARASPNDVSAAARRAYEQLHASPAKPTPHRTR
ncbi:hypothetical protein [uncultured Jatrophihabitans sp.]|uniref:hypothetical protein n=1 Tax=uncultured Jatrophihabitans sp. TaxID=1610747 RepID=UPI0035CAC4CA